MNLDDSASESPLSTKVCSKCFGSEHNHAEGCSEIANDPLRPNLPKLAPESLTVDKPLFQLLPDGTKSEPEKSVACSGCGVVEGMEHRLNCTNRFSLNSEPPASTPQWPFELEISINDQKYGYKCTHSDFNTAVVFIKIILDTVKTCRSGSSKDSNEC